MHTQTQLHVAIWLKALGGSSFNTHHRYQVYEHIFGHVSSSEFTGRWKIGAQRKSTLGVNAALVLRNASKGVNEKKKISHISLGWLKNGSRTEFIFVCEPVAGQVVSSQSYFLMEHFAVKFLVFISWVSRNQRQTDRTNQLPSCVL